MIFVTVGSSPYSFDRMLSSVDDVLSELKVDEKVVYQVGESNYRPAYGTYRRFFDFEAMQQHIHSADLIVSHAGIGSILLCLTNSKKPVVYPRLKKFREHVDDHQLQIALYWGQHGLVFNSPTEKELRRIVRDCAGNKSAFSLPRLTKERRLLIETVSRLL